jgi:hypothetical protein
MSYTELPALRDLFARDTSGLVNSTQRLILFTIASYESAEKGCFIGYDRLATETNLKLRALQENLHRLGVGLVWDHNLNQRVPCQNKSHREHFGIVKTQHYARKGRQQVLRIDLKAYAQILTMHGDAPFEFKRAQLGAPKDASSSVEGCTQLHPYKQDKQNKQLQDGSYIDEIEKFISTKLPLSRANLLSMKNRDLLLELEHKGTSLSVIKGEIEAVGALSINNPNAFISARLEGILRRPMSYSWDALPPKCANPVCNDQRKLPYAYEIESNPPGKKTMECPDCHPSALNRLLKITLN